MKRICMIIMAFVIMTMGSAAAYNPYAPNQFDTMDRNSWEYTSLCTLTKEGYSLTRYEMAQMVQAAIHNRNRATDEQKEVIDKLANEFANDLQYTENNAKTTESSEGIPFAWQKGGNTK